MSDSTTKGLEHWVARLNNIELPVLAGVMKEINSLTSSDDSSASHLAEIILKDASLTTKVLRIANSVFYNPNADNQITTISRAVVQLGFKGIKAITLSVMLVDTLLKNKEEAKQRMMEWLARGFHAAVQAEDLISHAENATDDEEVFVNSLLLHVGEMAFWSCRGADTHALDKAMGDNRTSDAKLEKQVLGTDIKSISRALVKNWDLGPGLTPIRPSIETEAVLLGDRICLAAEQGWDSDAFTEVLVDASRYTGLPLNDVKERILANAEKAASVAATFGANKICHLIPSSTEAETAEPSGPVALEPDPQLQLEILREIGSMANQKLDVNTLFSMVIEGLNRGVGLERVAICLIDPKVTQMQAKYVLGENTQHWRDDMVFPVKEERDNIFAYCLHNKKTIWLRKEPDDDLLDLVNRKMMRFIDDTNCIVSSIYAGNRTIGVLVADRGENGPEISEQQYESVNHFITQTNTTLAIIASNVRKK
jgi:hypothetical protein